jgi:hypothetical protein
MASAWVTAITAIAALVGVGVGQFWQGRREDMRWARERKLDAERREEQRQRDREMWAREDRHRFIEQKRQVYVEYQTCAYRISVTIVDTYRHLANIKNSQKSASTRKRELLDNELYFAEKFTSQYDSLKVVRNHLRLMASAEVVSTVTRIDNILIHVLDEMRSGDLRTGYSLWSSLRAARRDLVDIMRRDLNPESSPLISSDAPHFVASGNAEAWWCQDESG